MANPLSIPRQAFLSNAKSFFPGAPQEGGKTPEGVLRIGEEPFAGRFAAAAHLDIGKVIDGMMPRINTMISQPLDEAMELSGAFASMQVVGVDPIKDGFRLLLELKGTLSIVPRPGTVRTTGSMQPTADAVDAAPQKRPAP